MAIYRHEQARLSFSAEAGDGGYMEIIDTLVDAGGSSTTLTGAHAAGVKTITVASTTGITAGDYIQLEAAAAANAEVRRAYLVPNATTIRLDYPTGFPHAGGITIDEKTNAAPTGTAYTSESSPVGGINFATFLPGVYETITTPDLVPELLPQYFLKSNGNRNWSYMYRNKQTFNGSLPNFMLLNGYPLRFPFGTVATTGTDSGAGGSDTDGATLVGDRTVTLTTATGYVAGDFIQVGTGTTAEVRQVVSVATETLTLNYPLMIAHEDAETCNEVVAPFTHTLNESGELQTMTWHVLMRDSAEVAANDFIRRYVGGMVNRATLSADEGEMLRYSWDDVQFLDLVHNQTRSSNVTGDGAGADIVEKSSNMLLTPLGVGGDMGQSSDELSAPTYPTTEPYYFSQGTLSLMGVNFARVKNFRLEVNNNVEAKYYINDAGGKRIPSEFQEQNREYRLTATIALPDSLSSSNTSRSIWKELILEGNYEGLGNTGVLTGFDLSLTFTRSASDTITITSPSSSASSAFNSQGCFFTRGNHNIETASPIQVDGEIIMRDMSIVIVDAIGVYP